MMLMRSMFGAVVLSCAATASVSKTVEVQDSFLRDPVIAAQFYQKNISGGATSIPQAPLVVEEDCVSVFVDGNLRGTKKFLKGQDQAWCQNWLDTEIEPLIGDGENVWLVTPKEYPRYLDNVFKLFWDAQRTKKLHFKVGVLTLAQTILAHEPYSHGVDVLALPYDQTTFDTVWSVHPTGGSRCAVVSVENNTVGGWLTGPLNSGVRTPLPAVDSNKWNALRPFLEQVLKKISLK